MFPVAQANIWIDYLLGVRPWSYEVRLAILTVLEYGDTKVKRPTSQMDVPASGRIFNPKTPDLLAVSILRQLVSPNPPEVVNWLFLCEWGFQTLQKNLGVSAQAEPVAAPEGSNS